MLRGVNSWCIANSFSPRLLPCRHLICANCGVDFAQDDINGVLVHKGDCAVCSTSVVNMDWLKREPVTTSQVTNDRDPFKSVVSIQPLVNASMDTFKIDIKSEEEGYESQPSGSEYKYEVPGAFLDSESEDIVLCSLM